MKFREFVLDAKNKIYDLSIEHKVLDIHDNEYKPKYGYYSFILIAIGIEMLGGALDDKNWHKEKLSKIRFNLALDSYSSLQKYKDKNLFKFLRCGMAHILIPQNGVGLNVKVEGGNNLGIYNNQLLIQLEEFSRDFYLACDELIENIDGKSKSLNISNKAYSEHLSIPQDKRGN